MALMRAMYARAACVNGTWPSLGSTNTDSLESCSNFTAKSLRSAAVTKLRSCWPRSSQYRSVKGLRAFGLPLLGRYLTVAMSGIPSLSFP